MRLLGTRLHLGRHAIGDAVRISHCIPSSCTQNALLWLRIIHIIPSCQVNVAIDSLLLIPSVPGPVTSCYILMHIRAVDNDSDADTSQSNCIRSISHWYKSLDSIEVTEVVRNCSERPGGPVLKECFILMLELDFE
jgi:hypothetical protein